MRFCSLTSRRRLSRGGERLFDGAVAGRDLHDPAVADEMAVDAFDGRPRSAGLAGPGIGHGAEHIRLPLDVLVDLAAEIPEHLAVRVEHAEHVVPAVGTRWDV